MSQNESFRVAGSPHVSQPSGFAALASRWLTSMGSPAHHATWLLPNKLPNAAVGTPLLRTGSWRGALSASVFQNQNLRAVLAAHLQ